RSPLSSLTHLPPSHSSRLFPYTTLFRSLRFIPALLLGAAVGCQKETLSPAAGRPSFATSAASASCPVNPTVTVFDDTTLRAALADRKSTRLNSSHVSISYAVFCLKKKNT